MANSHINIITKVRARDGVVLGTFAVGSAPEGVAFDGTNIWVANTTSNNVTKLAASSGAVLGTFAAGTSSDGVAFDRDQSGRRTQAATRFRNSSSEDNLKILSKCGGLFSRRRTTRTKLDCTGGTGTISSLALCLGSADQRVQLNDSLKETI